MNEPSWIPSIRGSTHSVFILKFLFDAFCDVCVRASAARSRVKALARPLARSFHRLKQFLRLEQSRINIFILSLL